MNIREARGKDFSAMFVQLESHMHRVCKQHGIDDMEDMIIAGFEDSNSEHPIDSTIDFHNSARDFVNFVDGVVHMVNHQLTGGI